MTIKARISSHTPAFLFLFFEDFIYLFLERGREGKERKRNIDERDIEQLPLVCDPTRDQTHNPGMHPDGESKQ